MRESGSRSAGPPQPAPGGGHYRGIGASAAVNRSSNHPGSCLTARGSRPHQAHPPTTLPCQVIYAMDPPYPHLNLYRPLRERRGSQGSSCTPGWPGPGTGRHQLLARGDQRPDGPDRFGWRPAAHRGRRRDRPADVRPRHGGRPQHGSRRGTQRSGKHASTAGRGADVFAAAARHRGPVTIPGDAGPGPAVPGREPHCAGDESLPACGQVPAGLPARAREASALLSPDLRVPQDRTGDTGQASP